MESLWLTTARRGADTGAQKGGFLRDAKDHGACSCDFQNMSVGVQTLVLMYYHRLPLSQALHSSSLIPRPEVPVSTRKMKAGTLAQAQAST